MDYILIYDIPYDRKSLNVKVNRKLHAIKAEKLQNSIWQSQLLEDLKHVANLIRSYGGQAIVIRKKVVF
jgi:CRISPR/Cas system-associated endoribonuclease Cas2